MSMCAFCKNEKKIDKMFGSGENRGQNEDLFIRKKAFKQKHLGKNKKKCETPRIFAKTENYKKKRVCIPPCFGI